MSSRILMNQLSKAKIDHHRQIFKIRDAALDVYDNSDVSKLDDDGFALALNLHILLLNKPSADHQALREEKFQQYLLLSDRLNLRSPLTNANALETAVSLGNMTIVRQLLNANATPTLAACITATHDARADILDLLLENIKDNKHQIATLPKIAALLLDEMSVTATSPEIAAVALDKLSITDIENAIINAIHDNKTGTLQMLIDYCIAKGEYNALRHCLLISMHEKVNNADAYLTRIILSTRRNDAIKMAKESFVSKIASESDESKKIALRDLALDRHSAISQIMFEPTGSFECNINRGSLGNMMKLFAKQNTSSSSTASRSSAPGLTK